MISFVIVFVFVGFVAIINLGFGIIAASKVASAFRGSFWKGIATLAEAAFGLGIFAALAGMYLYFEIKIL